MAYVSLSQRDINVLEKIKDPESDPSLAIQVDPSLPKDPYISDPETYESISRQEREIIVSLQRLESPKVQSSGSGSQVGTIEGYRKAVEGFGQLIQDYPQYASARNNRVQALRGLYGDSILVANAPRSPQALLHNVDDSERLEAAKTALNDLDYAISLLTPVTAYSKLSPQVARTLRNSHTQRAAIYLMTSKLIGSNSISLDASRREARWSKLDFETHASSDFAMGARYGSEIAKGLAVSTNPTAKLCGQMVREAMKREFGPGFAA